MGFVVASERRACFSLYSARIPRRDDIGNQGVSRNNVACSQRKNGFTASAQGRRKERRQESKGAVSQLTADGGGPLIGAIVLVLALSRPRGTLFHPSYPAALYGTGSCTCTFFLACFIALTRSKRGNESGDTNATLLVLAFTRLRPLTVTQVAPNGLQGLLRVAPCRCHDAKVVLAVVLVQHIRMPLPERNESSAAFRPCYASAQVLTHRPRAMAHVPRTNAAVFPERSLNYEVQ